MPGAHQGRVLGNDVFELTAKGSAELHGSGTSLTSAEIEALVLLDGKSTVGETAARTRTLSVDAAFDVFDRLFRTGLIDLVKDQDISLDFIDFFETKGPTTPTAAVTAKGRKQAAATVIGAVYCERNGSGGDARSAVIDARPAKEDRRGSRPALHPKSPPSHSRAECQQALVPVRRLDRWLPDDLKTGARSQRQCIGSQNR